MTEYNVHLYREMRLLFSAVKADTPEAAAAIARDKPTGDADGIEDCEGETLTALVDVVGDAEYEQSRFIDFEQEKQRKAAPALLTALEGIIDYAENEAYSLEKLKDSPEAEAEADRAWKAVAAAQAAITQAKASGIATDRRGSPIEITEDEFDERFPLLTNQLNPNASWGSGDKGGCLFETYGEELEFVRQQDPRTVWTFIDGDDGDQYLVSGFHFVNRIGYLISTVPLPEGMDVEVNLPMDKDGDAETSPPAKRWAGS